MSPNDRGSEFPPSRPEPELPERNKTHSGPQNPQNQRKKEPE